MKFRQGKIIRKLELGGKKIIFRYPKMTDIEDLRELINSLVDEGARVSSVKKVNGKQELGWLKKTISGMKKGLEIHIFAEIDGKVVGNCSVSKTLEPPSPIDHVGTFGIILAARYRNLGLGTELANTLFEQAKVSGFEIIRSSYFEDNLASEKLHQKLGFKIIGTIPNCGKFSDKKIGLVEVYRKL